jgi:hypothetical protein
MGKSGKRRGPGKPQGMNLAQSRQRERQAFDQLVRAEAYRLLQQQADHLLQQSADAFFMAAADVFHMGPGRCEQFGQLAVEYLHEIASLVNEDYESDKDLVFAKEKIDRRMRQICGDKFQPWEVRYGRKQADGPDGQV